MDSPAVASSPIPYRVPRRVISRVNGLARVNGPLTQGLRVGKV